jgi:hypothetical protein
MTSVASAGAYLLSTPVELMPNAGRQLLPKAAALAEAGGSQLHALVRRGVVCALGEVSEPLRLQAPLSCIHHYAHDIAEPGSSPSQEAHHMSLRDAPCVLHTSAAVKL